MNITKKIVITKKMSKKADQRKLQEKKNTKQDGIYG